jgi:hypothetical protein
MVDYTARKIRENKINTEMYILEALISFMQINEVKVTDIRLRTIGSLDRKDKDIVGVDLTVEV